MYRGLALGFQTSFQMIRFALTFDSTDENFSYLWYCFHFSISCFATS